MGQVLSVLYRFLQVRLLDLSVLCIWYLGWWHASTEEECNFMVFFMCVCTCMHMCVTLSMWRSVDNLLDLVVSNLYQLNHLASLRMMVLYHTDRKDMEQGARDIAQWQSPCLLCVRVWVCSPRTSQRSIRNSQNSHSLQVIVEQFYFV